MPNRSTKDNPPSVYVLFILIVSLLGLLILAVEATTRLDPGAQKILNTADTVLCALFFVDFLATLLRAPDKRRYFLTWGWLDLISSIPAIEVFRIGRLARVLRILRVLRGVRSVRTIVVVVLKRRAQSALLAASIVALLMLVLGSIAALEFERTPESNIHGPQDAVWWAAVTLSTVGYGDRYPVTPEGRAVAIVLMLAGIGLFSTFSGFVASWLLTPAERANESELEEIRRELRSIREIIETKHPETKAKE